MLQRRLPNFRLIFSGGGIAGPTVAPALATTCAAGLCCSRPAGEVLWLHWSLPSSKGGFDSRRPLRWPTITAHGEWRSLVAHPAGGRAVAGSNPASPIRLTTCK